MLENLVHSVHLILKVWPKFISEESRTPSTPLYKGIANIMAEESGTPSTPHFQGIANNQLEESRTPSTPLLKGTAKIITEESGTLSTPHFQSKAKILSRIIWYTQYTNF